MRNASGRLGLFDSLRRIMMNEWYVRVKIMAEYRFQVKAESYKEAGELAESLIDSSMGEAQEWSVVDLDIEPFFDDEMD